LRQQAIERVVELDGFARIQDLSDRFEVSAVTIRSDLEALDASGRLRRIRGGAVRRTGIRQEIPFEVARDEAGPAKAAIARRAVAEVASGDAVVLDVGTTTTAIATELVARGDLRGLTVFTSSLTIAFELEQAAERLDVIVTGGTLRPLQHSLVEPLATRILQDVHADVVFLGCTGVHPTGGVTNLNLPETQVKQAMLRAARRRVVVADGSKFGEIELARVCPVEDAHLIITDASADPEVVEQLRALGVAVELVGAP
jgi:DeoR family transcriptional regulator of aga operon